jgi:hypothetical protein
MGNSPTISDQILGQAQPGNFAAPNAAPSIVPPTDSIIAAPPHPYGPGECRRLTPVEYLSRQKSLSYLSPTSSAIGSAYDFVVAVSDAVPNNAYWDVMEVGGSTNAAISSNTQLPCLWLVPPTPGINASSGEQYFRNPLFSQSAARCNDLPPSNPAMLRIDTVTQSDEQTGGSETPFDWSMRKGQRLYLPAGWRLAISNHGQYPSGGIVNGFITLKIVIVEMTQNEIPFYV